ncbi:natural killer cell receptor 2B4-like isoform X1 [Triplophysa rosa]|uniref:natural killer cell receptor 2B4-like isoform X1 n=2 Tax=Triplophysa rosa TaxID=992332 RepID=UPI002545D3CB|nr:natural killer cell receptor 2B4-like isoform X1 [Triplophysa rosa]
MIYTSFLCALCLWLARGVFGADADEVTSVSVMEGDSVTLHTRLTDIQRDIQILWTFQLNTRLAEIIKREQMNIYFVSNDGIFRDHIQMDNQTGSLIITNITTEHSGLYKLMIGSDKISYISFTVIVHARLPVPVITGNSSQCSSSSSEKCVLLCSVMNVTHVSLSWYKGKSLLSSISVSDLNIRLSLHLEVEYQDTNTYRCVINNPITHHTQHLHITDVCESCSALVQNPHLVGITVFLVMLVVATAAVGVMCLLYNRNTRHMRHVVQTRDEEEIHYADTTFRARHNEISKADDHTVYSSVALS